MYIKQLSTCLRRNAHEKRKTTIFYRKYIVAQRHWKVLFSLLLYLILITLYMSENKKNHLKCMVFTCFSQMLNVVSVKV